MFFRNIDTKIAKEKHRRLVLLSNGRYDRRVEYTHFTAFYVDDTVFRIWKDGEITRSDTRGWLKDTGWL